MIFLLFGRAEVQAFNTYWEKETKKDDEEEAEEATGRESDHQGLNNPAYDSKEESKPDIS